MKPAKLLKSALSYAALMATWGATAGPLPQYPILFDPTTTQACQQYGDALSCSGGLLNYFNSLPVTADTGDDPKGYIIHIPQGFLDQTLVLGTGSGGTSADNTDLSPTGIDDAYDTPNAPATWSTTTEPDPTPTFTGDRADTWDIEIDKLVSLLTIDGGLHEILMGFDHNQTGSDQHITVWGTATLVDLDNSGNNITYEFTDKQTAGGVSGFNSDETLASANTQEFVKSNAHFCIVESLGLIYGSDNDCPKTYDDPNTAGNDKLPVIDVTNNLGTEKAEFLVFLPELSEKLLACFINGFSSMLCPWDTVSFRIDIAEANNGFEDIFMLAGRELGCPSTDPNCNPPPCPDPNNPLCQTVPEPDSVALVGLAFLGLVAQRGRKYFRLTGKGSAIS